MMRVSVAARHDGSQGCSFLLAAPFTPRIRLVPPQTKELRPCSEPQTKELRPCSEPGENEALDEMPL
jgi:hypothetical protein